MYSDLFFLAEALLIAPLFLCFFIPSHRNLELGISAIMGFQDGFVALQEVFPMITSDDTSRHFHQTWSVSLNIGNGNDESSSYHETWGTAKN
ncbi:hypothetical protein J5N97_023388 [Dioscorea zingiberensis]|uniref:Uncharacterized protein n=1 Tax=Dioscorea zingiberensis TaxID=325984 RepID=A0A9D5CCB9_9LILI|nr:hypothetical protein J5N97_023388 [Dioscorea zingiberensis]